VLGRAFLAADALERMGEAMSVVDELRHHRTFDAQAAGLDGIVFLAGDVDDATGFQVDLQAAIGIAELARAVDNLVGPQRRGAGGEIELV
jgi:hypothetical protein